MFELITTFFLFNIVKNKLSINIRSFFFYSVFFNFYVTSAGVSLDVECTIQRKGYHLMG